MLEYFEKIWTRKPGLEEIEIEKMKSWLCERGFPICDLPEGYLKLLRESNGGDFTNGLREYQMLSMAEVADYYDMYQFFDFMPYAFPFAMDGCGNFYLFNLRWSDSCVYSVHAGDMGWDEEQCHRVSSSFEECIMQE